MVTGASRGIGLAVAREYVAAGARVLGTARGREALMAAREELGSLFEPVEIDLSNADDCRRLADRIAGEPITALVNNAGTNRRADIRSIDPADWTLLVELNLTAPARLSQAAARGMAERRTGRIVHIASIWAINGAPGRSTYGATKGALVSLARHMAVDLAPHNVLVNTVCPGFTDTELTRALGREEIDRLEAAVPLGRMADPAEIASLVVFLGSRLNTYITGQSVTIDGGFTIQ
ncbi:MAG: SDR family NAD(P)-dependent oxidoreductase [Vicinamibacterales bacterium]